MLNELIKVINGKNPEHLYHLISIGAPLKDKGWSALHEVLSSYKNDDNIKIPSIQRIIELSKKLIAHDISQINHLDSFGKTPFERIENELNQGNPKIYPKISIMRNEINKLKEDYINS